MKLLKRSQLQILLVAFIFSVLIVWVIVPPFLKMALIDTERTVGKVGDVEVTSGDVLTLFALFGTTVTVAVWLSSYFKVKRI